jgi:predicted nucleic acid-binding protein
VADLLVDTDVFIDHLRGAHRLRTDMADQVWYSVVTRCELLAGSSVDEGVVDTLLGAFREVPIDRAVAERAGRLRREVGIRTADALISASALERGAALLTRNFRDFQPVPGLTVVAPA